jgi:hypothetical protein
MENTKMKICKVCGVDIPEGRLKALPRTETCTEHSTAEKFCATVVSFGNPEDDAFQEIDILRDAATKRAYETYKSSLGTYK